MTIAKRIADGTLTLSLDGRLDTTTAPQLESEIKGSAGDLAKMVIDMEKVGYVSSAGLRVLLAAQKLMGARGGNLTVRHVCEEVMEVFEITGFVDILTIE